MPSSAATQPPGGADESPLRARPPASIVRVLRSEGVDPADLVLCTPTDLDDEGLLRPQWLTATRDRVLVASEIEGKLVRSVPLSTVDAFETEPGVGTGLMRARTNGDVVELAHYTNRSAYRLERAAAKLEQLRRGEAVEIHPEDEHDPRRCPSCGLLLDAPGASCPRCVRKGAVLLRMLRLMRPYRRGAIAMTALLVFGVGLDLVSPQLTRYLVDNVLPGSPERVAEVHASGRAPELTRALLAVVGVLAFVNVLRAVVNVINGRLSSRIGTAITFDMRSRLVGHLQQLSVGFYDRQQIGSLTGRVAYDTESLHGFIWQLTGGFILQIFMVVGVFLMMFTLDWRLALLALLPAPLVMGGTVFFWRRVYPQHQRAWDASGKQAGTLSGILSGIRVIKAFSQEEREETRFREASERLRSSRRRMDFTQAGFNAAVGLFFQVGAWLVWYFGGRGVLEGEITLGELMAFFGYLYMFYGPLAALPQLTGWLTQFSTQANRVFEVLDTPAQIAPAVDPVSVAPARGDVAFEGVTFGYDPRAPVIRDLSLRIPAGRTVGIVGHSGSGKSTLINLLCRFYDVDEGAVTLDGVDVRRIPKEELRSQIGVVLQDPFLFRGSIYENIAYGRPECAPEEVLAAAVAADCHDFILRHPHAYDTWLGERGAGLSGGERQRVGIARTLLTDPRVLVLDEATSSIDAESEASIQRALERLTRGRTTIAIAHRLSTLQNADRIVAMREGRIAEEGTHRELYERGGLYARLVRAQRMNLPEGGGDEDGGGDGDGGGGGDGEAAGEGLRWLTPGETRLGREPGGALVAAVDAGRPRRVRPFRAMPLHFPDGYVTLLLDTPDGRARRLGMIRDLREWPGAVRDLVRRELHKRYFVRTIRGIHGIELAQNYLNVRVETDLGEAAFTARWTPESIKTYGRNGKMITDADGNEYVIPNVDDLPARERALLNRFVYW